MALINMVFLQWLGTKIAVVVVCKYEDLLFADSNRVVQAIVFFTLKSVKSTVDISKPTENTYHVRLLLLLH